MLHLLCFLLKHFERRLRSTKLKLQIFISQTVTINWLISFIEQIIKYNETVTQWEKLNLRQNKNLCCSPLLQGWAGFPVTLCLGHPVKTDYIVPRGLVSQCYQYHVTRELTAEYFDKFLEKPKSPFVKINLIKACIRQFLTIQLHLT